MDASLLTSFIGVFVAVLLRTLLPYINKLREAEENNEAWLSWNHGYTWTCVSALVTGFIVAMLTLPAFSVPPTIVGQFAVFVTAFGYGWGINDAYNKILIDWR
ncbi:MAG: hypothetical protein ACUVT5_05060 [Candidatus Bathyarchaeales archaeon]